MSSPQDDDMILMPMFFMVDTSESMGYNGGAPIAAVNRILPELLSTCQANPAVRNKLRFSVVEFNTTARTVVPLGKPAEVLKIPKFTASGGTNYGEGFREVKRAMDGGLAQIKADGYRRHRPAVIIITDADPTDPEGQRRAAWEELTGPPGVVRTAEEESHLPNVAIFGVGDATEEQMRRYTSRHGEAFKAKDGVEPAVALNSIIKFLVQSIVTSVGDESSTEEGSDGLTFDPDELDSDVVVPVSTTKSGT